MSPTLEKTLDCAAEEFPHPGTEHFSASRWEVEKPRLRLHLVRLNGLRSLARRKRPQQQTPAPDLSWDIQKIPNLHLKIMEPALS